MMLSEFFQLVSFLVDTALSVFYLLGFVVLLINVRQEVSIQLSLENSFIIILTFGLFNKLVLAKLLPNCYSCMKIMKPANICLENNKAEMHWFPKHEGSECIFVVGIYIIREIITFCIGKNDKKLCCRDCHASFPGKGRRHKKVLNL